MQAVADAERAADVQLVSDAMRSAAEEEAREQAAKEQRKEEQRRYRWRLLCHRAWDDGTPGAALT